MKSYLHGLTAKGAGSAIRPIVTSLYAASGSGEHEAGALIEEGAVRRSEVEVTPKPRRGALASITGALDAASAGLMQRVAETPHRSPSREAAEGHPPAASGAFVPLVADVPKARTDRSAEPIEHARLEGAPMSAAPRAVIEAERTLLPQTPLTIRAAQAVAGRPASPAPANQPDQIEIHIGRIEVTAVTPPAAAPAPRPQQKKSLDLGEYLKGRDGRAS